MKPKTSRPGPGIRTQIVASVVLATLLGFGAVLAFSADLIQTAFDHERDTVTRELLRVIATELSSATPEEAQRKLDAWTPDPDAPLRCPALLLPDHTLDVGAVARLQPCVASQELGSVLEALRGAASEAPHVLTTSQGRTVVLTAAPLPPGPLREAYGATTRLLMVSDQTRAAEWRLALLTLETLFALAALILVCVVAYAVLVRLVARPLERVLRASERVAEGLTDAAVPAHGGAELQALVMAFNRLARARSELETKLHHRESELKFVNERQELLKATLVRAGKLGSVGQIAAGLAHEVGNPLGTVHGYLELLRRTDVSDEERKSYATECLDAVARIDGLVRELLDYSRGDVDEVDPDARCEVRDVVRRCVTLVGGQKRFRDIALSVESDDGPPYFAPLSAQRLQQVLLNLLINAADAIAERPRGATTESGRIVVTVDGDPREVRLHVADNGPGIPVAVRRKMFDAFFTTKDTGQGTGLGLAISLSIVHTAKGEIDVESQVGRGTKFTVRLPRAGGA